MKIPPLNKDRTICLLVGLLFAALAGLAWTMSENARLEGVIAARPATKDHMEKSVVYGPSETRTIVRTIEKPGAERIVEKERIVYRKSEKREFERDRAETTACPSSSKRFAGLHGGPAGPYLYGVTAGLTTDRFILGANYLRSPIRSEHIVFGTVSLRF